MRQGVGLVCPVSKFFSKGWWVGTVHTFHTFTLYLVYTHITNTHHTPCQTMGVCTLVGTTVVDNWEEELTIRTTAVVSLVL